MLNYLYKWIYIILSIGVGIWDLEKDMLGISYINYQLEA